ncbi:hypothetical protein D3C76_1175810 [compost metagenome]
MAGIAKAAAGAQMAGRSDWVHQYQQGIVIAVRGDADHVQKMAGGFALGPQTLLSAREKGHFTAVDGLRQRVLIHITQHQHFTGYCVLHDHRH